MKKAMRISGNFMQSGKWSEPDPGFEGYIVIDEGGVGRFDGYLNELYGPVVGMEDLHNEKNMTRLVVGHVAENGKDGAMGIAFMKLSADENQMPYMYVIPDLSKEGTYDTFFIDLLPGIFLFPRGAARVSLEEIDMISGDLEEKIEELTQEVVRASAVSRRLYDCDDECLCMLRKAE